MKSLQYIWILYKAQRLISQRNFKQSRRVYRTPGTKKTYEFPFICYFVNTPPTMSVLYSTYIFSLLSSHCFNRRRGYRFPNWPDPLPLLNRTEQADTRENTSATHQRFDHLVILSPFKEKALAQGLYKLCKEEGQQQFRRGINHFL